MAQWSMHLHTVFNALAYYTMIKALAWYSMVDALVEPPVLSSSVSRHWQRYVSIVFTSGTGCVSHTHTPTHTKRLRRKETHAFKEEASVSVR